MSIFVVCADHHADTPWIYYDGGAVGSWHPIGSQCLAVHACPLNKCKAHTNLPDPTCPSKPAARSGEETVFSIHCTADHI